MNNLIFIHGGNSTQDDATYIRYIREDYAPTRTQPWSDIHKIDHRVPIARRWIDEGGQVYYPMMPNTQNARYRDWKIVFEAIMDRLGVGDRLTLVGGSLGGCFLLKYFGELKKHDGSMPDAHTGEVNPLFIDHIHLLAACISEGDFTAPENYDVLRSLGSKVHIWHAEDDMVVPVAMAQQLQKELPDAVMHVFGPEAGYGHFHGIERLPELEAVIFL